MATLQDTQQTIAAKRKAYTTADAAYYAKLQAWSLTGAGADGLPAAEKSRDNAFADLQTALAALHTPGGPQQWITEVSSGLPFLLLPVRLESRYVTVRHMLQALKPEDVLDISQNAEVGDKLRTTGFIKDEDGVMTYRLPSVAIDAASAGNLIKSLQSGELKPKSGKWIQRKDDTSELRIRMYPDDIFFESFEPGLQAVEWNAGTGFWQRVCAGNDPQTEWLRLSTAYKPARTAWIIKTTHPTNYTVGHPLPATPVFPADDNGKDGPYTQAPKARLLPDQFVVRLYKGAAFKDFIGLPIPEPLTLGLDPTHDPLHTDPASGMSQNGTAIQIPAYLDWIHDFDAAEKNGLALRVDLQQNPEYASGVDRILVMGVKLSVNETDGETLLSALMQNHLYKEDGMSVLPKGTATNNFGGQKSGYNDVQADGLAYFNAEWLPAGPATLPTDESRFAAALGLDASFRMPLGVSSDISDALRMNGMLWPATWGYYLQQFFTPAINEATRELARQFFTQNVTARGLLPVIRINRQPYGVIPVSSMKDWQYGTGQLSAAEQFSSGLWTGYLSKLYTLWQSWIPGIKTVAVGGQGLDGNFFDIVSMSPTSGSLQRQWTAGMGFQAMLKAAQANPAADIALLSDPYFKPAAFAAALTATGVANIDYSQLISAYHTALHEVRRVLMDGLPVAEDRPLELIAGKSWNYIEWLAQARMMDIWNADYTNAPAGNGAVDSSADVSVFAVLARQAVLRAFLESGLQTVETHPGLYLLKAKDFELQHLQAATLTIDQATLSATNLVHQEFKPVLDAYPVTGAFTLEPDRRQYFNKTYPATGSLNLSDWLDANKSAATLPALKQTIDALTDFSQTSSAALERLLMEHLDLCSHRLDGWISGLMMERISKQRAAKPRGILIGAYGWLLGLTPGANASIVFEETAPVYLDATPQNMGQATIPLAHFDAAKQNGIDASAATWNRAFFYLGSDRDPGARLDTTSGEVEPVETINLNTSDGFIHAPSSAHATAAAILRSAFLNHPSDDETAMLALQLNSPRVRKALQLLDGLQQGNSIGELLGYHFERLLHDNQLDQYLYDLRGAFPLPRTGTDGPAPSPLTGTDGQTLLNKRRTNPGSWLNGVSGLNNTDIPKIDLQAAAVEDELDALNDLLLAESVYQTAKGNRDRASAALRIMSGGGHVLLPEWVRTPMKGNTITHRVAVMFQQSAGSGWTSAGSPGSAFMTGTNAWLAGRLPAPSNIAINVMTPDAVKRKLNLSDLAIEPVDLLAALPASFAQAAQSPLASYVQLAANRKFNQDLPMGEAVFSVDFKDRSSFSATEISLFEIAGLLAALKKIVSNSRALSANDFLLPDQPAAAASQLSADRLKTTFQHYAAADGPALTTVQSLRVKADALNTGIQQNKTVADLKSAAEDLLQTLLTAWQLGVEINTASGLFALSSSTLPTLVTRANAVATELESRVQQAQAIITSVPGGSDGQVFFDALGNATNLIFAGRLTILPDVLIPNADEVKAAYDGRASIKMQGVDDIQDWMREASLVRKNLQPYRQSVFLAEALAPGKAIADPVVLQFPFFTGTDQPWVGGQVPGDQPASQQAVLSMLIDMTADFQPTASCCGMMIDEWPEWIPSGTVDSGLSFQFDQPDTEPPQAILLAVTPVEGDNWVWEHLAGAVNEALTLSQTRLITGADIRANNSGLDQVLPAVRLPFLPDNQQTPVVNPL